MSTRELRVGVLADSLGDGGGIDRYVTEILRGLAARPEIELTVVADPAHADTARALVPRARAIIPIRGRGQIGRARWERDRLGRALARSGVQIVHGTKHILPRTSLARVLTVHDLTLLTQPWQFPVAKRLLMPSVYRGSLRRADAVIAVSETTRRRLLALEPTLRADVVVAPNGASTVLTDVEPDPLPGIEGRPFALVVGDLSPRKNLDLLLGLWDDVTGTTGLLLVVVGPDGWRSDATRRRVAKLVGEGHALRPGRVSDAELRWCYEHARMVLYPSIEEGFGLPVAEALSFGAPVIAGTDAAVVEVGDGVPTHVDPHDRDGWRTAILRAAADSSPRVARPQPGWDRAVDRTIDAYRRAWRRAADRRS